MDSRVSSPPLLPQAVYAHSKVTLTCRPAKPLFTAGQHLEGILELACSSDKVWLGGIALEIRGAEQLHSRDHAASQAFLQADITFQSAKLPPSNAVIASSSSHSGFWPARKGVTRSPFSFAIPPGCPSSCKFGGNASVTYTLLASCQIQLEGERQILTRRLDVNVVEQWQDWQHERFHEPSEAQVREKIQSGIGIGALGKTEGTVYAQALIQDRLFYRGWESPDGSLEMDRARGEICTHLSIRNGTPRTISGLKMSLLRRLKILPSSDMPTDQTLVISAASAPRITETVEEVNLHGRGWEFPPSDEDRVVDCILPLPVSEKFLSVRKTKLFEIHTVVKVSLDMGTLNKPISFELPIWVAHWASLPPAAHQPRAPMRPPLMRPASSQGLMRARSAGPYGIQESALDSFGRSMPMNRPPFTTPQPIPLQRGYASTPAYSGPYSTSPAVQSPADISYQSTLYNPTFISFNPEAASMTPSRFMKQQTPWLQPANEEARHWTPLQSPTQVEFAPISLASSAPASSYFQMLAQQRMTPSPKLPESITAAARNPVRSNSAESRTSPYTPGTLPPRMQECLTPAEQARVLANSAPAVYDVTERAYTLRQQEEQRNSPNANTSMSINGRQRRQSMPTPSAAVQGRFSPVDAAPSRPFKTPPLAPSSRFTFALPYVPPSDSPDQVLLAAGLETIGEDGESQAGTVRLGKDTIARSASHEQIRSLKAVRAVNSAVDDEGNTSVSFLEGIAEQQDRAKEAANRVEEAGSQTNILAGLDSPNVDKTLPKPPPDSDKSKASEEGVRGRRRIFDVFPEIAANSSSSPPKKAELIRSVKASSKPSAQTRTVSGPSNSNQSKAADLKLDANRPLIKSSKSDSLIALEARLSRPSSPMSPTFGNDRPPSMSPPPRSNAVSPVQRAISPVHIGNEGALRKKISQISMRKQQRDTQVDPPPAKLPETQQAKLTPVCMEKLPAKMATRVAQVEPSSKVATTSKVEAGGSANSAVGEVRLSNRVAIPSTQAPKKALTSAARKVTQERLAGLSTPVGSASNTAPYSPGPKTAALVPRSPKGPLSSSSPASSKRSVSDPQNQSKPMIQQKSTTLAQVPRRQSLGLPSDPADKFGSARGGRGGVVTSVASLWADIITQESKNAKNDVTLATPAFSKKQASAGVIRPAQGPEGAKEELHKAVDNARKRELEQNRRAIPAVASTEPSKPSASAKEPSQTPQAPKAKPAIASVNATMGKPPTFAKPLRSQKPVAQLVASTRPQGSGPGGNNLKALIARFS